MARSTGLLEGELFTGYTPQFEILWLGLRWLRHDIVRSSDLFGYCPRGAPRGCVGGPMWSVNGKPFISRKLSSTAAEKPLLDPLFMMHHAVR